MWTSPFMLHTNIYSYRFGFRLVHVTHKAMCIPSKNMAVFAAFSANDTIPVIQAGIRVGWLGWRSVWGGGCSGFSADGAASGTSWADSGGCGDNIKAGGGADARAGGGKNARTGGVKGDCSGFSTADAAS
jgi:hypothetical protein